MRAQPGDWLIVEGSTEERHARRAEIRAVDAPDGSPPYWVHWLDTGHEGLFFPGPDARVVSAGEQAEIDRVTTERTARVQSAITQRE